MSRVDFSVDLSMLPASNFSPFEQCLFLLNNLEGIQQTRKNSLKSALILSECTEHDLTLILEDFLRSRNAQGFVTKIEHLLSSRDGYLQEVRGSLAMAIHEESVSEPGLSQRLLETSQTSDSFLIDEEQFVRPTKKAVGQSSLLAELEFSRDNTLNKDSISICKVQQSIERSSHLPLQPARASSITVSPINNKPTTTAQSAARFQSPDLERQLIALNSTTQIRNTHSRINDAVQNFRAILAASKNYAETKMFHCDSVSPFKKEVSAMLEPEMMSPLRGVEEGTSAFTRTDAQTKFLNFETEEAQSLLSPLAQPKTFNQRTIALATGLRYVKTSDLLFLLEDYAPDKNISRENFCRMVQLLRESVVGSDAPLPADMLDAAITELWTFIKTAQEKFEPDRNSVLEEDLGDDYANVMVVGPALILLTKGTLPEKVQGAVEIASKGGDALGFEQVCGVLYEMYEMIYRLEAVPKVIKDKVSTFDLARFCAVALYEFAEIEPQKEPLHHRSIEFWLTNPDSVGETVSSCGGMISHETSVTCGITFRDSDPLQSLFDNKAVPKEGVPKLDLNNTQGLLQLKEKCQKMIANAEKIQKRPHHSRVETLDTLLQDSIETRSSHRASKSLVPLPSQRGKAMLSPTRRNVPQQVRRFQKLNVIELEQAPAAQCRLSCSFKESSPLNARHLKCSSMFMQTMKLSEDLDDDESVDTAVEPCLDAPPAINVLGPKQDCNVFSPQDDVVRFSTDSISLPMSKPRVRQAPKVLKFTVKSDEELLKPRSKENKKLRPIGV